MMVQAQGPESNLARHGKCQAYLQATHLHTATRRNRGRPGWDMKVLDNIGLRQMKQNLGINLKFEYLPLPSRICRAEDDLLARLFVCWQAPKAPRLVQQLADPSPTMTGNFGKHLGRLACFLFFLVQMHVLTKQF